MFRGLGLQSAGGCSEARGPAHTPAQTSNASRIRIFTAFLSFSGFGLRRSSSWGVRLGGRTVALEPLPCNRKNRQSIVRLRGLAPHSLRNEARHEAGTSGTGRRTMNEIVYRGAVMALGFGLGAGAIAAGQVKTTVPDGRN